MKKRIILAVVLGMLALSCVACSSANVVSEDKIQNTRVDRESKDRDTKDNDGKAADNIDKDFPEVEPEPAVIMDFSFTNQEIFETGYYAYQFDNTTMEDANVYFHQNNVAGSDVEWKVYVVDNELTAEEVEQLAEQEPITIDQGATCIKTGQWIYVLCNINSKTADDPSDASFSACGYATYI